MIYRWLAQTAATMQARLLHGIHLLTLLQGCRRTLPNRRRWVPSLAHHYSNQDDRCSESPSLQSICWWAMRTSCNQPPPFPIFKVPTPNSIRLEVEGGTPYAAGAALCHAQSHTLPCRVMLRFNTWHEKREHTDTSMELQLRNRTSGRCPSIMQGFRKRREVAKPSLPKWKHVLSHNRWVPPLGVERSVAHPTIGRWQP